VARMRALRGLVMKLMPVVASFCVSVGVRTDVNGTFLLFVPEIAGVESGNVDGDVFRNVV